MKIKISRKSVLRFTVLLFCIIVFYYLTLYLYTLIFPIGLKEYEPPVNLFCIILVFVPIVILVISAIWFVSVLVRDWIKIEFSTNVSIIAISGVIIAIVALMFSWPMLLSVPKAIIIFRISLVYIVLFTIWFIFTVYKKAKEVKFRDIMKKFVGSPVAEQLLKNTELLKPEQRKRKELSILFIDLKESITKWSDYSLLYALEDYYVTMAKIIADNGGMVDKFIGDGIMGIFGAPVECHDHATKAVKASIDMISVNEELCRSWVKLDQPVSRAGIGISTGNAVVGLIGSTDKLSYTVLGNVVKVASNLSKIAKPGQILITDKTYESIPKARIDTEEIEIANLPKELTEHKIFAVTSKNK